jgi:hypothetical protein
MLFPFASLVARRLTFFGSQVSCQFQLAFFGNRETDGAMGAVLLGNIAPAALGSGPLDKWTDQTLRTIDDFVELEGAIFAPDNPISRI